MGNINITQMQHYVDDLYQRYEQNEEEKTRLLADPNVKRYAFISEENQSLMMLLQEAKFQLKTLQMESCDHVFLKVSNETDSWNVCVRCGVTNKHKVINKDNMSFEQQEIFQTYKKTANHGIFLESDQNLTDNYISDVYDDIILRHPDATQEQIVEYLDEYFNVKKQNSR